jgi:1-acyl-sn-glycerol-3-phosphate acyltransferase
MSAEHFHTRRNSRLYAVLRPLVKAGTLLFHRKIVIAGAHHIPSDGPVLLVANHQNAMLDPVILCVLFDRQLHWLTRSDVFANRNVRKILFQFNMLPVYRERDRARVPDWSERNQRTFDTCYARWKKNAVVAMFPEGTHRGKKQLHLPLKKGAARLVFGASKSGVPMSDFRIVPVGIDYSDYFKAGGKLIVSIGKPVGVKDILNDYSDDETVGSNQLTEVIREALTSEMIDIRAGHDYDEYMALRGLSEEVSGKKDDHQRLQWYLGVLDYLHHHADDEDKQLVRDYVHATSRLKLDEAGISFASETAGTRFAAVLFLWLVFPVRTIARFMWLPFASLVEWFISTRIKDSLFFNSIRLSAWTFIAPLYATLLGLLAYLFTCNLPLALLVMLTLTAGGWLTMKWNYLFHLVRKSRRFRLMSKSSGREMQEWTELRTILSKKLRHWHEESSKARR